ncbi:MAG: pyridoxamine 5'-phosphate oxidase family protein [Terriglobales bacterium]
MPSPTERTRLRRYPARGSHDRAVADAVLDEGLVCHVGFVSEGQPYVIPTAYAREGDAVFLHGSAVSRMLRHLRGGLPVCVTVTLLDGLVLARSSFHNSMNYRSVVVLGVAQAVEAREPKLAALRVISEHLAPGRWQVERAPSEQELAATLVLRLPIEEFSVKRRSGPPLDDPGDVERPIWAGVVPLRLQAGAPVADALTASSLAPWLPPSTSGH